MQGTALLWIDDAHVLHPSTLKGLKRLLELTWRGEGAAPRDRPHRPAGPDGRGPGGRASNDPVPLRGALGRGGLRGARRIPRRGTGDGRRPAARGRARRRNWLDLHALADHCLLEAAARGESGVTVAVARQALGAPAPEASAPASDEDVTAFLQQQAGVMRFGYETIWNRRECSILMRRWFVNFRRGALLVHKFESSDDVSLGLHDHPWDFLTIRSLGGV